MTAAEFGEHLALVNAFLNGAWAVLIFAGWRMILRKRTEQHRRLMLSAFAVSSLFLVCYLTRVALTGTHKYPGHGALKAIYYAILFSHMTLAVATPPLVIRSLFLALKKRYAEHRALVAYTLPIWFYVSVTGVLVYLLLYHAPTGAPPA